jgi:hypothetical protein
MISLAGCFAVVGCARLKLPSAAGRDLRGAGNWAMTPAGIGPRAWGDLMDSASNAFRRSVVPANPRSRA